jgi:hypothetical protein
VHTIQQNKSIECAELVDALVIECLNAAGNRNFPLKDTVLFKYQGSEVVMADTSRLVAEISTKYGGTDFQHFDQEKDADEIWNLRKNAYPYLGRRYSGYNGIVTDVWYDYSFDSQGILVD